MNNVYISENLNFNLVIRTYNADNRKRCYINNRINNNNKIEIINNLNIVK